MSSASDAAPTSTGPVLVTGCSSGIGAATADLLVKAGHTVYATARRTDTLTELEAAGARVLALDVTSAGCASSSRPDRSRSALCAISTRPGWRVATNRRALLAQSGEGVTGRRA